MEWNVLRSELDNWQSGGPDATFWWRDDDATSMTTALERLLALARDHRVSLALAVIPASMTGDLPVRLQRAGHVRVLQHGYGHVNHATRGGAWELGLHRPMEQVLEELAVGFARLSEAYRSRFLPFLVPPWNRIDPALIPHLSDVGLRGLSTFGARASIRPAPGIVCVNTHCDPIRWKEGRRFAGVAKCVSAIVGHLRARRTGEADPSEPTGLLTHHLAMDEDTWIFVEDLLNELATHPRARLCALSSFIGTGTEQIE